MRTQKRGRRMELWKSEIYVAWTRSFRATFRGAEQNITKIIKVKEIIKKESNGRVQVSYDTSGNQTGKW